MELEDDGITAVARVNSLRILPATDEQLDNPEDSGSSDINDGSDTSRVQDSAITYSRECLRSENYTEATLALRSALEISNPMTSSYKMVVLHIAQLLKAAQQPERSIECLTGVYKDMPPPFSRTDGLCMIALTYEQLGLTNMARMWWKKLNRFFTFKGLESYDGHFWEAIADRLFDGDLYLYAADFYSKAMTEFVGKESVPSNRFRYCYLTSLLGFIGPQGPTAHMNCCRAVAWSLAQWFRHRNESATHLRSCYSDPHFYLLRQVYFTSFPAMYRVVFAWLDVPAARLGRWWRHQWATFHSPPSPVSSGPSPTSRLKRKEIKHPASPTRQSHKTGLHGKVSAFPLTPPTSTRKSRHTHSISRPKLPSKPNRKTERQIADEPQLKGVSNNGPMKQKDRLQGHSIEKRSDDAKKPNEFGSHSPSKRTLRVVKRLRARRPSADPTVKPLASSDFDLVSTDTTQTMVRSSSTSLLDVYPLEIRDTEAFVASCGREPGFADLDLDEVGEFARLAHYRARVLAGKHTPVTTLDATKVKPQWLQELEKAITLIETYQQRNMASGRIVVESDSVAHLSEVHTRLVHQITTLCQQYARDYGETVFTRRLRGIIRRLVQWKFSRISEVIADLDGAKTIATEEEKQRNLEFYHVHGNPR